MTQVADLTVGPVTITGAMIMPKAADTVVPTIDLVKGGGVYVQSKDGAVLVHGDKGVQMVPDGVMHRIPVSADPRAVSKKIQHAMTVQCRSTLRPRQHR